MTAQSPRWVGMLALVIYIATGLFPYLASGVLIPIYALVLLLLFWGVGLVFTARMALRRPVRTLWAAPVAIVFWAFYVAVGSAIFGWTA